MMIDFLSFILNPILIIFPIPVHLNHNPQNRNFPTLLLNRINFIYYHFNQILSHTGFLILDGYLQ